MRVAYTIFSVTALIVLTAMFALIVAKKKVGDVRPAVLPPTKDITKIGDPLQFPLTLPPGFRVGIFAKGLGNARDLTFSPKGTLLVSISARGSVVALPDRNNDGKADEARAILTDLNKPHGIALFKSKLFVAEETRVVRYTFDEQALTGKEDKVLFSLPRAGRHITRTIAFDKKGVMFVSIGSTCDVCFEKHPFLGTVIISDEEGRNPRVFARGLRNSVFIAVDPKTDKLWGTEMGRDFLGDNKPPDEINVIEDGKDYGWPVCYGDRIFDEAFGQKTKAYCNGTEPPLFDIAAHSAPLGLAFIYSEKFPKEWQGDLLVAYHGSWNRSTPIGYRVVRLALKGGTVVGEYDFITGFLKGPDVFGRPVDVAFDKHGSLFVSDDKAGVVYKVLPP